MVGVHLTDLEKSPEPVAMGTERFVGRSLELRLLSFLFLLSWSSIESRGQFEDLCIRTLNVVVIVFLLIDVDLLDQVDHVCLEVVHAV